MLSRSKKHNIAALENVPDNHIETIEKQTLYIISQRTSFVFGKL